MKAIYFDLIAGASGDMILGGLIDAGVSPEELKDRLKGLKLDEFDLQVSEVVKNGFRATKVNVKVAQQPPERHLAEILEVVQNSDLPAHIKKRSGEIFQRIAEVEAGIHGQPLEQVHLHELGGTDTIVDVAGALLALDILEISRVFASPVPVGSGFIQGAHGEIPLPAPATLKMLEGIPVRGLDIQAELVTPTGAALLSNLVDEFIPLPEMILEEIGYGAGTRDLPIPNLLRVLTGILPGKESPFPQDLIVLECSLDDLIPEIYSYVMEELFHQGALDVNMIPIQMKKNRPGTQIQVLAEPADSGKLREILFRETTTLGIKQYPITRFALPRQIVTVQTSYGEVRVKVATTPDGIEKISPEYEDCYQLAKENSLPIRELYAEALSAFRS